MKKGIVQVINGDQWRRVLFRLSMATSEEGYCSGYQWRPVKKGIVQVINGDQWRRVLCRLSMATSEEGYCSGYQWRPVKKGIVQVINGDQWRRVLCRLSMASSEKGYCSVYPWRPLNNQQGRSLIATESSIGFRLCLFCQGDKFTNIKGDHQVEHLRQPALE